MRYQTEPLSLRRPSRRVRLGTLAVGDGAPISVQSMTNTLTTDVEATLAQTERLAAAGADAVRVSCPDEASTQALRAIVSGSSVPIIADIHFHYRRAIESAEAGASCLRFNPGNIGSTTRVAEVVRAAQANDCSIRIGVNSGSLERDLLERYGSPCAEALVESALRHAAILEDLGFSHYKISCKASDVAMAVRANRMLAARTDAPLHIGITESGSARFGSIRSAAGLGILLAEGIGDTLRISLAGDPEEEVHAGVALLKSLGLREGGVLVVACPGCARQQFDVGRVTEEVESRLAGVKTSMRVSVMGCVVNGPGEAASSTVGLTGGGRGTHRLYRSGSTPTRLQTEGADAESSLAEAVVAAALSAAEDDEAQARGDAAPLESGTD